MQDYYKKIEMTLIRVDVVEDCEATMVRFLSGFNMKITDILELKHCGVRGFSGGSCKSRKATQEKV